MKMYATSNRSKRVEKKLVPVVGWIFWQEMGEIVSRMPRMREGFTPHADFLLAFKVEEIVEKFYSFGMVLCGKLCSFFRRQLEKLGDGGHGFGT